MKMMLYIILLVAFVVLAVIVVENIRYNEELSQENDELRKTVNAQSEALDQIRDQLLEMMKNESKLDTDTKTG